MKPDPFATELHKPSDNFKNNSLNLVFRVKYLERIVRPDIRTKPYSCFSQKIALFSIYFYSMSDQVCALNENRFNMSIFFHVRQSQSIGQRERDNLVMPGGLLDRRRLDL